MRYSYLYVIVFACNHALAGYVFHYYESSNPSKTDKILMTSRDGAPFKKILLREIPLYPTEFTKDLSAFLKTDETSGLLKALERPEILKTHKYLTEKIITDHLALISDAKTAQSLNPIVATAGSPPSC